MIGGSTSTKWFFVYLIPGRIGIWKCWFLRRGENRSTQRKTSRSKEENQQWPCLLAYAFMNFRCIKFWIQDVCQQNI